MCEPHLGEGVDGGQHQGPISASDEQAASAPGGVLAASSALEPQRPLEPHARRADDERGGEPRAYRRAEGVRGRESREPTMLGRGDFAARD